MVGSLRTPYQDWHTVGQSSNFLKLIAESDPSLSLNYSIKIAKLASDLNNIRMQTERVQEAVNEVYDADSADTFLRTARLLNDAGIIEKDDLLSYSEGTRELAQIFNNSRVSNSTRAAAQEASIESLTKAAIKMMSSGYPPVQAAGERLYNYASAQSRMNVGTTVQNLATLAKGVSAIAEIVNTLDFGGKETPEFQYPEYSQLPTLPGNGQYPGNGNWVSDTANYGAIPGQGQQGGWFDPVTGQIRNQLGNVTGTYTGQQNPYDTGYPQQYASLPGTSFYNDPTGQSPLSGYNFPQYTTPQFPQDVSGLGTGQYYPSSNLTQLPNGQFLNSDGTLAPMYQFANGANLPMSTVPLDQITGLPQHPLFGHLDANGMPLPMDDQGFLELGNNYAMDPGTGMTFEREGFDYFPVNPETGVRYELEYGNIVSNSGELVSFDGRFVDPEGTPLDVLQGEDGTRYVVADRSLPDTLLNPENGNRYNLPRFLETGELELVSRGLGSSDVPFTLDADSSEGDAGVDGEGGEGSLSPIGFDGGLDSESADLGSSGGDSSIAIGGLDSLELEEGETANLTVEAEQDDITVATTISDLGGEDGDQQITVSVDTGEGAPLEQTISFNDGEEVVIETDGTDNVTARVQTVTDESDDTRSV